MPSYNPTNPLNFDQNSLQNQQNNLQNFQSQSQKSGLTHQNLSQSNNHQFIEFKKQQPSSEKVGFSSAETSPVKKPASMTNLMENSSSGFHKFQIKNLINANYTNNTITISLVIIYQKPNSKINSFEGLTKDYRFQKIARDIQQQRKKLTIFNSLNSSSSSPLDEMLSTANSSASKQNLLLIKNRQIKNASLQHIEMPQKLQIHSTVSKSSIIQNVWGSSSNLDQTNEQSQSQPKEQDKQA
ncbi:hypothetical protein ABPG72_001659 [Tetrahymena utriculariae]